jgi:hypothetical protein
MRGSNSTATKLSLLRNNRHNMHMPLAALQMRPGREGAQSLIAEKRGRGPLTGTTIRRKK